MRSQKSQNGHVMVVLAVVLVVLLGFTALAVDIGMMYSARASAQRAADAAALAGAFTFVTDPTLTSATAEAVIDQYAISAAAQNTVLGAPVTIGAADVDVSFSDRRVTVRVDHVVQTLFARVLGSNSANIHAEAIAEASLTAVSDGCTKPWFIPNTVLSTASDICDPTQGACTVGELLIDPATRQVTMFAQNWMQVGCPTRQPRQFIVKPQNPNAEQVLSPGTFMAIQLGGAGASVYENNIPNCPAATVSCSQTYSSEQGNMVGPTQHGVERLIYYEANQVQNCNPNICTKDTYIDINQYQRPDGTISSTSRSLVVAPVIDVCTYCPGGVPNGSSSLSNLPVIGFALIFVEDFGHLSACGGGGGGGGGQQGVLARLINIIPCPSGGGGGGGSGGINPQESGPFSVPVRLVRL